MYTEQDLQDINQQFKRRLAIYAVPATLLIAVIVVSLVYRNELATELLFIALGALSIFCWGAVPLPRARLPQVCQKPAAWAQPHQCGLFQGL
ncbi:MAG: hypothetical protein ACOX55_13310 [Christensenellales bacterium]